MSQGTQKKHVQVFILGMIAVQLHKSIGMSYDCIKHTTATTSVLDTATGHCYYYFNSRRLWVDAKDTCEAQNTNLLHLESDEEQDWLHEALIGSKVTTTPIWLGMKTSADWYWSWHFRTSDRPLNVTRWSPSSDGEHPASVWVTNGGQWQQVCSKQTTAEFVCEDPHPSEVTWPQHCDWDLPNSTVLYSQVYMHCYYVLHMTSWSDARATCEMAGAYLLHLETTAEHHWLLRELKARGSLNDMWLGLVKRTSILWTWVDHSQTELMRPRVWLGYQTTGHTHARLTTTGYTVQTTQTDNHLVVCEGDVFLELLSEYVCETFNSTLKSVFERISRHCYYLLESTGTLDDAFSWCSSMNARFYPLQLETAGEQNMLSDQILGTLFEVWLGVRFDGYKWVWQSKNKTAVIDPRCSDSYDDAYCGDPDRVQDAVVVVERGKWLLHSPTEIHDIVCEEELSSDDVSLIMCWEFPDAIAIFSLEQRTCYFVFSEPRDWHNASAVCKAAPNTHVLNLETSDEQSWIEAQLNDIGQTLPVWLGLQRTAFNQWSWIYPTYTEVAQSRRFVGYNDNGPHRVRTATPGKWSQTKDTDLCGLVCEQPITLDMLLAGANYETKYMVHHYIETHDVTPSDTSTTPCTPTTTSSTTTAPHSIIPCPHLDGRSLDEVLDMQFQKVSSPSTGFELKAIENTGRLACAKACVLASDCDWFMKMSNGRCALMTFAYDGDLFSCGEGHQCFWKECKMKNLVNTV